MNTSIKSTKETPLSDEEIANKLNPNNGFTYTVKNKYGAVSFMKEGLSACCGIGLVSGFSFGRVDKNNIDLFYQSIKDHLLDGGHSSIDRGNIMLTDAVGGEKRQVQKGLPCIYSMCLSWGLSDKNKVFNPRTGHHIVIFNLEREVIDNDYNNYYVDEDGDVQLVNEEEEEEGGW